MAEFLILRERQIYNQYFHLIWISRPIFHLHIHTFDVYKEHSYLGKRVSDFLFRP